MDHPKKRQKVEVVHPLGVKPSGNSLMEVENVPQHRLETMGLFGLLSDELLFTIIQDLDKESLLNLGHTSKSMYAYCHFDELWKQIVYKAKGTPKWRGSWRLTALNMPADKEPKISAEGKVYSDFLHRPFELSQIDYSKYIDSSQQGSIPVYEESYVEGNFDTKLYRSPFVTQLKSPIARWSLDDLVERFGNEVFRQEYMDWPLEVYKDYCHMNHDESPLYLFDCKSKAHHSLEFSDPLPELWSKRDLFTSFGAERPDHQWLIIGPKRSGSTFHKDPNATSAWNSVISGHKYWIMFPKDQPPPGVWTSEDESEVTAPTSLAEWFNSGLYKASKQAPGFCDAVTGPGQVMYVPSGWWHAVVNLDDCIAMTGNFVVEPLLRQVLSFLKDKPDQISGFKHCENVYERFMELLEMQHPEVIARYNKKMEEKKKKSWKSLTKDTGTFTFGFQ